MSEHIVFGASQLPSNFRKNRSFAAVLEDTIPFLYPTISKMSRDPTITALLWTHLCRGRYFLILFLRHFPVCLAYLMKEPRTTSFFPVERCLTGRVDDLDMNDRGHIFKQLTVLPRRWWLLSFTSTWVTDSLTSPVIIEKVKIFSRFITGHSRWWSKMEHQIG